MLLVVKKYPGVETATHSIDFAKGDEAAYERFASKIKDMDIGVLGTSILLPGRQFLTVIITSEQCW